MDLRAKIRKVLNEQYGGFKTELEHEYEVKLTEKLMDSSSKNKMMWATYNQIVIEFKNTIKDDLRVKELQYKLTDDSENRDSILESIENFKSITPELERLYYKIKNFKNDTF
jgi:hypothetical protein